MSIKIPSSYNKYITCEKCSSTFKLVYNTSNNDLRCLSCGHQTFVTEPNLAGTPIIRLTAAGQCSLQYGMPKSKSAPNILDKDTTMDLENNEKSTVDKDEKPIQQH